MYLAARFGDHQSIFKKAKKMTSWETLDNTLFAHMTHVIQDTEPRTDIQVAISTHLAGHLFTQAALSDFTRYWHSKADTILEASKDYD